MFSSTSRRSVWKARCIATAAPVTARQRRRAVEPVRRRGRGRRRRPRSRSSSKPRAASTILSSMRAGGGLRVPEHAAVELHVLGVAADVGDQQHRPPGRHRRTLAARCARAGVPSRPQWATRRRAAAAARGPTAEGDVRRRRAARRRPASGARADRRARARGRRRPPSQGARARPGGPAGRLRRPHDHPHRGARHGGRRARRRRQEQRQLPQHRARAEGHEGAAAPADVDLALEHRGDARRRVTLLEQRLAGRRLEQGELLQQLVEVVVDDEPERARPSAPRAAPRLRPGPRPPPPSP